MEKMGKKRFPLWKKMEKIEFPYFYIFTSFFKWIHYIFFEFYGKNGIGKKEFLQFYYFWNLKKYSTFFYIRFTLNIKYTKNLILSIIPNRTYNGGFFIILLLLNKVNENYN